MKIHALLAAMVCSVSAVAFAQSAPAPTTPKLDAREVRQEQRIEQGVKSGSLTEQEAKQLNKSQDRLDKAEAKAKADGTVSPKERARLDKMADRASKGIMKNKHDGQQDANHDGKMDKKHGGAGHR